MATTSLSAAAISSSSFPPAAGDLLPAVTWVRPMIRRAFTPQCKIVEVRGEERWEYAAGEPPAAEDISAAKSSPPVEALEQQMEQLAVISSSSSTLSPPAVSVASTPSTPQKGTPKKLKQNNSSTASSSSSTAADQARTPSPVVKSNGKNKQPKHTETTDGAQGSPSSSGSALIVPPSYTVASVTSLHLTQVTAGAIPGLEYSSRLGSKDRVTMHTAAEDRGLEHESLGFRPRRHLYVQKKYDAVDEDRQQLYVISRMGHIYLEGFLIDTLGSEAQSLVDEQARKCRLERDGMHYHCTLVHSSHVEQLKRDRPKCLPSQPEQPPAATAGEAIHSEEELYSFEKTLVDFFAERLNTPIREFGLGRASAGGHTAYFRVLQWPQLNDLRVELGLGQVDLHVTVGFKTQDVHGVSKNVWTLCQR